MKFVCRYAFLFISLFVVGISANAQINNGIITQPKDSILNRMTNIEQKVKEYAVNDTIFSEPTIYQLIDSVLSQLDRSKLRINRRDTSGIIKIPRNNWEPFDNTVTFGDTVLFDPVFLPVVFNGKVLPADLDFLKKKDDIFATKLRKEVHLINPDSTFAPQLKKIEQIEETRRNYYVQNPERVRLNAFTFSQIPVIDDQKVKDRSPLTDLITAEDPIVVAPPEVERLSVKQKHWLKDGIHTLKISQNNLSSNWNGVGGEDNFNVENYHKVNLNYKKGKIQFNNTFEWRLNFLRTPADTMRSLSITDDFFRIYSALALESFVKNWSYTITMEAKTPIFKSYPKNSNDLKNDFLSPLNVNPGIGMNYKLNWKSKKDKFRNLDMSIDVTPLSIQYTYVRSDTIDVTRFGVEKGHKSKTDLGSTINLNLTYNFNKFTAIYSRFKYFTSYEKVIAEWENRWDYNLNRYLTMSLYLYLRYDDGITQSVKEKATWDYFQYNQRLSFGLSYKW